MRISNPALSGLPQIAQPATHKPSTDREGDFGQMLMDAIQEVSKAQNEAAAHQEDLMANRPVELHDVMIAMERAGVAFELTMQVRNKLLEAYQEISRMQV